MNVIQQAIEALEDITSGWKYIRSMHGDLYGVGWDRAQGKAEAALASLRAVQEVGLPPLPDEVVRYCPECGTIGPLPDVRQACCPDSFGMSVRRWQAEKMERKLEELRTAIAAAGGGVPPGWKLVPVEPTAEMWAAVNKLDDEMAAGGYDGKGCTIEQAWECLLASSPQPEAAPAVAQVPQPDFPLSAWGTMGYAKSALSAILTHMGMDEDEWNRPTFEQARSAVRALEYQLSTPDQVNLWKARYESIKGPLSRFHQQAVEKGYDGIVDALAAATEAPAQRCPYCDDTGDVHTPTGEWRGRCTCPAGTEAPAQATPSAGEVERWKGLVKQARDALSVYQGFVDDAHILEGQWHWIDDAKATIDAIDAALSHKEQP